ncbi:MAG: hypothetical protein AAFR75_00275 [Pseudomonadota bacterium]
MTPEFKNYKLDELIQAANTIDRQKYPERLLEVERLIALRKQEWEGGGFVSSGERRADRTNRWYAVVRRLEFTTVLKLVTAGLGVSMTLWLLLVGIAAVFGADIVEFNGANVHGIKALLVVCAAIVVFVPVLSLVFTIAVYIGLRLYALFRPICVGVIVDSGERSDEATSR